MLKLIISVLFFVPLTLFSQERKPLAKLVGSYLYSHPKKDYRGNVLAITEKDVVSLIDSDGIVVRQVTPQLPLKGNRGGFYLPTKGQALFLNVDDKFEFYSTEKEVHKIATFPGSGAIGRGLPLALRNGNVLATYSDGTLKVLTPLGKVAAQADKNYSHGMFDLREFADGTIVLSQGSTKNFLSPELKLIKQINLNCQIPSYYGHAFPSIENLVACYDRSGKVYFLNSNGETKFTFQSNGELKSHVFLPNNFTALMFSDGNVYFLDSEGKKIFTHFHDTSFYSNLVLVSDKVLAYWNKTEIVFLDFNGKELGTFIMPRERQDSEAKVLVGLGNGTVLAVDGHVVHFIKLI